MVFVIYPKIANPCIMFKHFGPAIMICGYIVNVLNVIITKYYDLRTDLNNHGESRP